MSYDQAAGSGISSQQNSQHGYKQKYQQNSKGTFYNEKMIVCMSDEASYEQLADALYDKGFWKFVRPGFHTRQMPRPRHKSKAITRLSSHPSH